MTSDAVQFRRDFWTKYAELYPDDGVPLGYGRNDVRIPVESAGINVLLVLANRGVRIGVRGRRGELHEESEPRIASLRESFHQAVGDAFAGRPNLSPLTEWKQAAGGFDARRDFDAADRENWQYMAEWLHHMLHMYQKIIKNSLPQTS